MHGNERKVLKTKQTERISDERDAEGQNGRRRRSREVEQQPVARLNELENAMNVHREARERKEEEKLLNFSCRILSPHSCSILSGSCWEFYCCCPGGAGKSVDSSVNRFYLGSVTDPGPSRLNESNKKLKLGPKTGAIGVYLLSECLAVETAVKNNQKSTDQSSFLPFLLVLGNKKLIFQASLAQSLSEATELSWNISEQTIPAGHSLCECPDVLFVCKTA